MSLILRKDIDHSDNMDPPQPSGDAPAAYAVPIEEAPV